ncbi:MAG: hypothetical protein ACT4OQ_00850 [Chloroflexota bacterium]
MPVTTILNASAIVRRDDHLLLVVQQAPGDPEPSWTLALRRLSCVEWAGAVYVRDDA